MFDSIAELLKHLPAGLAPLLLGGAVASGSYGPPPDPPEYPRRWRGFEVMVLAAGWAVFVALAVLFCLMGLVPGVIFVAVVCMVYFRRRTARQHALLWTMAVASERLIPLGPAVRAFAAERMGGFAMRAEKLADLLEAGVPLPAALDAVPGLLPADAMAKIRIGYDAGSLAPAVRDVIAVRETHEPFWNAAIGKFLYLLCVVAFAVWILAFMMLKIAPQFEKIFMEFDTQLPGLTRFVINGSYAFVRYWWVLLVPVVLVVPTLLVHGLLRISGARGPGKFGFFWLERRLVTASVLEGMAIVAERGRPLAECVASLAANYPSTAVRSRLTKVLRDVQSGFDWCNSLAAHGLIGRAEVNVLQAAQRVGDLPWALREMAESNRRRQAYRAQIWSQILFPLTILLIGLAVGIFVIGFFMPMVSLINKLT